MEEQKTAKTDLQHVEAMPAMAFRCPDCDNPQGVTDRQFVNNLIMGHSAVVDCPNCGVRFRVSAPTQRVAVPSGPNRKQRRAAMSKGGIIVPGR
jgi:transcription elongation factor Elf1